MIKHNQARYHIIGVMSGTSCDGVDLAYCSFKKSAKGWGFEIRRAVTIPYDSAWFSLLQQAHTLSAPDLLHLHSAYGTYLGKLVRKFCKRYNLAPPDAVASHGHTVFHQPDRHFTFQLGNGYALHQACGFPVIWDFRSLDVALGGEGAPLVPVGDALLFADYDVCLNLGGIANLSYDAKGKRKAFDVCLVNMALNYLAGQAGKAYDKNGELASQGNVNMRLFRKLLNVYKKLHKNRPSLSREWFETQVKPLLDSADMPVYDKLATCVELAAVEIVEALPAGRKLTVLCTGGGAFNAFLMYRLLEHGRDRVQFIVPEEEIVSYKEALVFAFLGVLRLRGEMNALSSVTGATRDSCGGVVIGV